jgi:dienelactone hydrolase
MRGLLIAVFLALPAVTCVAEELPRGRIVDPVACAADPSQTYALYLPAAYSDAKRWPILFVFDPRHRGAFAAELFRDAAEKYGWIIVSSNDTRSDGAWEPNEKAVRAMWPDTQRYAVDRKRIYATGFSGGAMLAWSLTRSTGAVAGIIGCSGRLADPHDADRVAFDWFGTAGDIDFNYSETRLIDARLDALGSRHRMVIFHGGHRWAPPEVLAAAIGWMELQAMKRGTRPWDEAMIAALFAADLAAARGERDDLAALRHLQAIAQTFDGLIELDGVRQEIAARTTLPSVARLLNEEKRDDALEAGYRARLPTAINGFLHAGEPRPAAVLTRDLDIPRLRAMARQSITAQRILETIAVQLELYLPRDLMERKNYAMAATILTVAREIHPERPDLLYDLACANALAGRKREALEALEQALALGFHDAAHAASDPDLASLRGDPRFGRFLELCAEGKTR